MITHKYVLGQIWTFDLFCIILNEISLEIVLDQLE